MEEGAYQSRITDRIRRFVVISVSVLLLLSLIVLVLVGVQSLTAIAAAFTVFALAIIFVLGILGISKVFCCYACDGPVRRSFWFISEASIFANSMPGSTRGSIIEIPYPDSTDLPLWTNDQQQPPDYFSATNCGDQGIVESYPRQETPPPSYKFLAEAGLIEGLVDGSNERLDCQEDMSEPNNMVPKESGEDRTSVAIIFDEDKPSKQSG